MKLYDYDDIKETDRPYSLWFGSQREGNGEILPVHDPATGEQIARVHTASEDDVAKAVETADLVFRAGDWSRTPRQHRADVLDKAAELLLAGLDELIALEVRQTGRPVREMKAQVPSLARWFRYYAALLRTEERAVLPTSGALHNWVDRVPLGVVALVTPFNHPLLIAVKKLAPALAAGNSVVLKPSELTPLTSLLLGPVLTRAGVPEGVFFVLPGHGATAVGRALVGHPLVRKVDLTGGTVAGRAIGAVAGANLARYTAELGGKAPLIVMEGACVEAAVNGIAFGSFVASGQTCVASTRILVHRAVMDEVRRKLAAKARSIEARMGAPSNPASTMGPVISARQLRRIEELVASALDDGAEMVHGGRRLRGTSALDGHDFDKGHFYAPTILDIGSTTSPRAPIWKKKKKMEQEKQDGVDGDGLAYSIDTRLWREEAFGPVIVLAGFETEAEAVALANDSEYGLGAGLWTTDMSQAFRVSERLRAGVVWVNTHHRNDPSSPWGGVTAASGVGSENGADAYREYTMAKSTVINYAATAEAVAEEDWFGEGGMVRYG